ncbi:MAG: class I SAM-dependent methyltransferase [Deltaproteobacteria bacterium]|nr:class I SAM-dependent methyltransferase [Deltaproteobacteria bacterium]MCW5807717.1 class I SAM-dependent methyltransferase [Deltaproteobacteria bacterium]
MTDKSSEFLDTERVAEFWNQSRRAAQEDQQTGYLQDEWPAALGANRLEGEWGDVSRWLDELKVPTGACLDVGCGVGVWLERFAARFERAHGIDLSSEMVASAQARMAKLGLANATVTCQGALDLPDDARYDFIFVGGCLMYLNDSVVEGMVARLSKMLRPGGLLVLRESTSMPNTWYRDKPLGPGLFAVPGAPRPPYYCIYRTPPSYVEMAERQHLAMVRWHANRHYKLADMSESWLKFLDKIFFGRLAKRRASAERAARWVHRLRFITLLPWYYLIRTVAPRSWKINNYWYLCAPAPASAPPEDRSS